MHLDEVLIVKPGVTEDYTNSLAFADEIGELVSVNRASVEEIESLHGVADTELKCCVV